MLDDSEVERILVVTAHPDDVDFGAAGSVARWTASGIEVSYCIVTDGDAGGYDPDVPREEIPSIRRLEQTNAAKQVGVTELHFLGFPDGAVQPTLELRKAIARVIRITRPRRVVTQSPVRTFDSVYRNHPDHIYTGEAAMCAVYPDARNPFTFPELAAEGLEAWSVDEVLMMGGAEADTFVDITDTFDQKIDALMQHESQITDRDGITQRLREWNGRNAELGGLGEGRLAEAFRHMPTA